MFGKWNLGNNSPRYLPTARGFDYFLGYMDGSNNYWSKTNPSSPGYLDFMYADKFCFYTYDGPDLNDYSSTLYGAKASEAIQNHDFDSSSMFMYLSYQVLTTFPIYKYDFLFLNDLRFIWKISFLTSFNDEPTPGRP